jgi:hypothetical protein
MDRAMAGPSMAGPSWGAFSDRDERVRIRTVIRGSRLISRDRSADPSLWRTPLMRPAQEDRKNEKRNKTEQKEIAFFRNIPLYYWYTLLFRFLQLNEESGVLKTRILLHGGFYERRNYALGLFG